SAPAHFVPGAPYLSQLDEGWTLMPLVVLDVRARIAEQGGDFLVGVGDLHAFERRHGRIPRGGCVLLLTGFSRHYSERRGPGRGAPVRRLPDGDHRLHGRVIRRWAGPERPAQAVPSRWTTSSVPRSRRGASSDCRSSSGPPGSCSSTRTIAVRSATTRRFLPAR